MNETAIALIYELLEMLEKQGLDLGLLYEEWAIEEPQFLEVLREIGEI